ncbi:hypothetical protein I6A84_03385 [Frankia sp. CNm7]|uniref:Low molecular weight antigen MTB12-like C-terminal domain-containing protein n=1 Tax=Frankia nepalensis TaxID=1836974 RepID=A0A937RRA6_9ACTN|nr:hypothetical protein [Frankia nepalensis]MBL7498602.1 hypothetical protein [Frankia nepalensis]MBL7510471.1 hypothetical protein [Frankia nepalensis]MBL7517189.1 hypothetical protein [Frankia nepalensis]MBL7630521.1 hypothetical protein [Frankia nepalensis]
MTPTGRTPTDRTPTTDDLAEGIRALRGPLARRRALIEPAAFAAGVRARARRRRARVLIGGVAGLVVLVAAGVAIPTRLLGDGSATVVAATDPSEADPPMSMPLYAHGGFTVGWLPAGMTHRGDLAARVYASAGSNAPNNLAFAIDGLGDDFPLLTQAAGFFGPFSYISQFALPGATDPATLARSGSTALVTPAAGLASPALIWVTVTWDPYAPPNAAAQLSSDNHYPLDQVGTVDVAETIVASRPAVLARADSNTASDPARRPTPADHRYRAALLWTAPDGTLVTVEAAGPSPVDPAVIARVAEGIELVGQPAPPAPPDETTADAVRAAFHDAFAAGVPDDQFAAAVQDGPALASLRDKVAARYPRFAATLSVRVDQMLVVAPGTVSAGLWVSFTDPTVSPRALLAARNPTDAFGEAVLTPAGWQVTRAAYCDLIMGLGTPDLRCPR